MAIAVGMTKSSRDDIHSHASGATNRAATSTDSVQQTQYNGGDGVVSISLHSVDEATESVMH
jgi:hypothetical protein